LGYTHRPRSSRRARTSGAEPRVSVTGAQRVASSLNTWLRGTHQGVGADHLQAYLNEFVFRFNRRFHPTSGFDTLLALVSMVGHDTWEQTRGSAPEDGGPRRRGKATQSTSLERRRAAAALLDA
jgi:hypothetical protein